MFHPLEWANEVLVQTNSQIDREHHAHDSLERLDTAEEIFTVNGRKDQMRLLAVCRPHLLVARADFASAIAAAIKVFDDQSIPAPLRIRAGIPAVLTIGQTLQLRDARALVGSFAHLCKTTALDEDVLAGLAALGRNRLFNALSEAGIATALKNCAHSPPIRSRESLRALAAEVALELEAVWRASGIAKLRHVALPLTLAWARCISDENAGIAAAFAAVRMANPSSWPVTTLMMEGQAYRWAGAYDRSIAVLTRAIDRAKSGAVLHKEAFAHFEIAQAYSSNRQFDKACAHILQYCSILQTNLERSNVHVASAISPIAVRASDQARESNAASRAQHLQPEPPYLKRARRYIEANLHEDLSMNDIVDSSGVSRRSLEMAFRKLRGVSPIEYLRQMRLEKASKLLSSTDWPIHQVREAVGYRRASAFSCDFRKRFGISPMSARKNAHVRAG